MNIKKIETKQTLNNFGSTLCPFLWDILGFWEWLFISFTNVLEHPSFFIPCPIFLYIYLSWKNNFTGRAVSPTPSWSVQYSSFFIFTHSVNDVQHSEKTRFCLCLFKHKGQKPCLFMDHDLDQVGPIHIICVLFRSLLFLPRPISCTLVWRESYELWITAPFWL